MSAQHGRSVGPMVIVGTPGSGKGTQSLRLSAELGVPCFSVGSILRREAGQHNPAAFRLRQLLASGMLVSDDMVCGLVEAQVRKEFADAGAGGLILDGFPRTMFQAVFLDSLLADLGARRPFVIHLEVPNEVLLRRLTARRHCAVCGEIYNLTSRPSRRGSRCERDGGALVQRDDDSEAVIMARLETFYESAAGLIEYYSTAEYSRVDGAREPAAITEEMLRLVSRHESFAAA